MSRKERRKKKEERKKKERDGMKWGWKEVGKKVKTFKRDKTGESDKIEKQREYDSERHRGD